MFVLANIEKNVLRISNASRVLTRLAVNENIHHSCFEKSILKVLYLWEESPKSKRSRNK